MNGQIAKKHLGQELPVEVMQSAAGYYIGTSCNGLPCSRESLQYYRARECADQALQNGTWTQREEP